MAETDTDFTNKVADKALRAKAEKLECENESDQKALTIIMSQKNGLTTKQREWLKILCDRRGKKFVFLGDKQSAKPDRKSTTSSDAPLNSRKS